jgi:hypothetical protein
MRSNDPFKATSKGRVTRARLAIVVLVGVLLCSWAAFGAMWIKVDQSYRAAVAETDRRDPGWRLEDFEAKREVIPADANGAVRAAEVFKSLPEDWKTDAEPKGPGTVSAGTATRGVAFARALSSERPNVLLLKKQKDLVRAECARVQRSIDLAREMVRYPKGRYQIQWGPNVLEIPLPHAQNARTIAWLLQLDVLARAQRGDADGALQSCLAMLNVGRSLGDEPFAISQLVRIATAGITESNAERALARGEPSDDALSALQNAMTLEATEPLELYAIRGERALFFRFLENLENGSATLRGDGQQSEDSGRTFGGLEGRVLYLYNQRLGLELFQKAVEIAKKPVHEQGRLWPGYTAQFASKSAIARSPGALTYLMMPALEPIASAAARHKAMLGACAVMLAAERYRLLKAAWPRSAQEIESALAIKLPIDPYSEEPVRLKRTDDGLIVYSVGPDLRDNDAALNNARPYQPNVDVGFTLWDVEHRRQSPAVAPQK